MLRRILCFYACLALALVASLAPTRAQTGGPFILDGPAPAFAFDVNAAGRIAGSIAVPDGNAHAVLWRNPDAAPGELLLLPGTNWSRAFAVNARGQIAGQLQDRSVVPVAAFAAYWDGEGESPVALASGTLAVAINSAGQAAGNMRAGTSVHAAVWDDPWGDPQDLGTFGGASSGAADLNDGEQIVGMASYADGSQRAAFWPSASETPVDLGTLDGATPSAAAAINERGEIVGEAFFAAGSRRVALIWTDAGAAPISLMSLGGASSQAVGIDNRGRIVGQAQNAGGEMRAVLWPGALEPPIDLGPGFARAVNARGLVVGDSGGQAVAWAVTGRGP